VTWLFLTLISAVLMAGYDFLKKSALRDNAVFPVLFGGIAAGSLVCLPIIIWSAVSPSTLPHASLQVTDISLSEHLQILVKSTLVVTSWIFGYLGLKSLPLSIATPIRATSPLWTILFAIVFFAERPSPQQWLGVGVILVSFFIFSLAGKKEGIEFHRSKAVGYIIVATVLGASSAIMDKVLLQNSQITPNQVQVWFSLYCTPLMLPALLWWRKRSDRNAFEFRWSIPAIGLVLLAADYFYFNAIAQPDALISLISPVRRSAVVISFILGIVVLKEQLRPTKIIAVCGILAGVFLLA